MAQYEQLCGTLQPLGLYISSLCLIRPFQSGDHELRRVGGKRGTDTSVDRSCLRQGGITGQSFSHRPSPNRTCSFHCIRLSSIVVILAFLRALTSLRVISVHVIGSPCSIASWHLLQSISVFRRRAIIRLTHSGFDRPGYSWSFRIART